MRELPDLLEDVERDREIAAIRERLAQLDLRRLNLKEVSTSCSLPRRRRIARRPLMTRP